ncbi:MAG TPA: hypothetical protein VF269_02420 [Rhodanobacteraceae bacterium]
MTVTAAVDANHRQRILHALGVTMYALRGNCRPMSAGDSAIAAPPWPATGPGTVALVLPEGVTARERGQVDRIMQALGGAFVQAPGLVVTAGELPAPVPPATVYLVFGKAQAQALGRGLDTDVMAQAEVLLLDSPDRLFQAEGKRRLWQALGGLRRQGRRQADDRE